MRTRQNCHEFIDDKGQKWPASGWDVAKRVGAPFTGSALADFVVTNLGWLEIKLNHRHFHVRCRPAVVAEIGVIAMLYALHDAGARSITLSVLGARWAVHAHCDQQDVLTILSSMMGAAPRKVPAVGQRFLAREVRPAKSPLFKKLRHVLANVPARSPSADFETLLDDTFNGRWTLSHTNSDTGQAIVDHCGRGFTQFNPKWRSNAVGTSLHSYADEEYGAWVASHRQSVSSRQRPLFDDVDAIVHFPSLGDVRLTYTRLTAPLNLPDGRQLVLSAAESDVAIDFRKIA